jgi:gliding motility-associated-like protein
MKTESKSFVFMKNIKKVHIKKQWKKSSVSSFFWKPAMLLLLLFLSTFTASVFAQNCPVKINNNQISLKRAVCVNTSGLLEGTTPSGGNGTYLYQWEIAKDNCGENSFVLIAGANNKDYIIPAGDNGIGCYRRVVVSGSCKSESNKIQFKKEDRTAPVPPSTTVVQPLCGSATGTITITNPSPSVGITYSIDGANYTNETGIFTGLQPKVYTVSVKYPSGCISPAKNDTIKASPLINGSISPESANICNGGSVKLTVSGGTSYQWYRNGTTITGATAATYTATESGNYTADILIAACRAKAANQAVVKEFEPIKFAISTTQPGCSIPQGSLTISTVTGGSGAGYLYSTNNGSSFQKEATFSTLSPGDYQVVVKDGAGCTSSAVTAVIRPAPEPITVATMVADITCTDSTGAVTLEAKGGLSPYQYQVNTGAFQTGNVFTGLVAGTYKATVKDAAGCTQELNFTVKETPSTLSAVATPTNATCKEAGKVSIKAEGGTAPFSYSLDGASFQPSSSFTNLPAGLYQATIKDAKGCGVVVPFEVKGAGTEPITVATMVADITCTDSTGAVTLEAKGGLSPYQYQVNTGAFQTGNVFTGLVAGTYKATVKDAAGCTQELNFTVKETPSTLSAVATPTNATCKEAGKVSIKAEGGTAPFSYSLDGASFQPSSSFTNLPAGLYQATIKDAKGCGVVVPFEVKGAGTEPITVATMVADITCTDSTGAVTLEAKGGLSPYQYQVNTGAFQTGNVFTGLVAGTYKATVKDAAGCTQELNFTVKETPSTLSAVATPTNATCKEAGKVSIKAEGGTAPFSYSLDGASFQPSSSFTNLPAGLYQATIKDAKGCGVVVPFEVKGAGTEPITVATMVADITCTDSTGAVTLEAKGGLSPYQYQVNTGAFQTGNVFTGLVAGTYKATVKDAAGCTQELNFTVKETPSTLSAVATPTNATCKEAGKVSIKAEGGTAPFSYSLDGASFQPSSSFTNLPAGLYQATIKDAKGCGVVVPFEVKGAGTEPITVATMVADITCTDSTGAVTLEAKGGLSPYQYQVNTGAFQTGNVFTGLVAGTYKATVKDAAGCTQELNFTVKETPSTLSAVATPTNATCKEAGKVSIKAEGGTAPFSYSLDGASFQPSSSFTNLPAGLYQATIKDAKGCGVVVPFEVKGAGTEPITVATMVADITCTDSTGAVTLEAKGGLSPYQYQVNTGAFQTGNVFTGLVAGTYKATVKDAAGCTQELNFTVKETPSTLSAVATPTNATCKEAGKVSIKAEGGTAPFSYSLDGASFQPSSSFTNLPAGLYQATIKDAKGCGVVVPFEVKGAGTEPTLTVTNPPAVCSGSTLDLRDSSLVKGSASGLVYSYWKDSTASTAVGDPAAVTAGTYYIKAVNAEGCSAIKPVVVTEQSATSGRITASGPTVVCFNQTLILTASSGTGYQWYRNDDSIPGATAATYQPKTSGNYSVVIINGPCKALAANKVQVQFQTCSQLPETSVAVPSAFTPNRNGANDVLRPVVNNIASIQYFKIFNRWGQMVFETTTVGKGWDGTISGIPQPADSYSWILVCTDHNGNVIKQNGRSLLIR